MRRLLRGAVVRWCRVFSVLAGVPSRREEPIGRHFGLFGHATTPMNCMAVTIEGLKERAWVHHIQRLMDLSKPALVHDWMRERYIDGADWVMGPNVMGWSCGRSAGACPPSRTCRVAPTSTG